jgi:YegS/Rv2252/BmrU family lipid kinase
VTQVTVQRTKRAAVVYNPLKGNPAALRKIVAARAKEESWGRTMWLETTIDDAGQELARRAVEKGVDLVIAAGGDGTVRAVSEGLRGTGIPLGIVPAGTGNLLARNLAIPLSSVEAAIRVAFTGVERSIDVGIAALRATDGAVSEHAFVVMAGLGIDATIVANTNATLKKRVGWLAYVESGMRTLRHSKPLHVHYQMTGHHEHSVHVSTIMVGNCGVLPGNVELMPDARLDDGELDVAVLQPRSVFGWLLIWRKVSWENRVLRKSAFGRKVIRFTTSDRKSTLTYLRGTGIDMRVDEPQEFELDGDEFGEVTRVNLSVDERSLVVRVPPPWPAD